MQTSTYTTFGQASTNTLLDIESITANEGKSKMAYNEKKNQDNQYSLYQ